MNDIAIKLWGVGRRISIYFPKLSSPTLSKYSKHLFYDLNGYASAVIVHTYST